MSTYIQFFSCKETYGAKQTTSILKNFRLDPWVVRTLKAIQEANKEPNEKQTIVAIINDAAAQKGLLFKPCPNVKDKRKDPEGLMIQCTKNNANTWLLFDPNCLKCGDWQPAPTPTTGAPDGG